MGPGKTDKRRNPLQKKNRLLNILCQCYTEHIQPEETEKLGPCTEARFIFIFMLVINTYLNKHQVLATPKAIGFVLKKRPRSNLLPNRRC